MIKSRHVRKSHPRPKDLLFKSKGRGEKGKELPPPSIPPSPSLLLPPLIPSPLYLKSKQKKLIKKKRLSGKAPPPFSDAVRVPKNNTLTQ